jgi:serine protease Do
MEPNIQLDPNYKEKPENKIIRTVQQDHRRTVIVAACSALAVVILALGIVYIFRTQIFSSIASDYATSENTSTNNTNGIKTALFSGDNIITSAVKKTNPAVVSITISKDVPKYETQSFVDPFGFFSAIPKQNGTTNQEIGNGSGFLVSADGYIVTNRHVVEDSDADYTVTLNDGKKYVAKIIAIDELYDIAIIKIEGISFQFVALGDSSTLELGSTVIAIGNALGQFKNTVSVGVVSGLSRSITAGDGMGNSEQLEQVIQTDAAINPGNSGGPLLDLNGAVVGINVAVAQGSQSIGFALPINSVKGIIASVKATGKIIRPYIGVRYIQVDAAVVESQKLSVDYGVLVRAGNGSAAGGSLPAILKGSPAEKAGLKEGDVIVEVDGKKLDENQSLGIIVREHKVGDTIVLKIIRGGATKTISVKLEEAPAN